MIRRIAPGDAALAFAALRELRPTSPFMASLHTFQAFLEEAGRESYALVGSFEEGRREAVAVAGYRVMTMLYVGRLLYVDDLSTLPEFRGRGHAGALLHWLEDEAIRLGAAELHLDSGTGPARFAAHRQYLKHGLNITAHHFSKELP